MFLSLRYLLLTRPSVLAIVECGSNGNISRLAVTMFEEQAISSFICEFVFRFVITP